MSELPLDPAAVRADDALIDALRDPNPAFTEDRFAAALLAWCREIESEPITRGMDTDTALALVRRRGESRGLRRLARWLREALRGAR